MLSSSAVVEVVAPSAPSVWACSNNCSALCRLCSAVLTSVVCRPRSESAWVVAARPARAWSNVEI